MPQRDGSYRATRACEDIDLKAADLERVVKLYLGDTAQAKAFLGTLRSVDRAGTVLITDALPAYRWVGRKYSAHLHVNHSAGEYVREDPHAAATAHVNTAESFNATLKRAWVGVFPWFSIKHTDRYLHEVTFRWNARQQDTDARLSALFVRTTGRLRWKELVA